MRKLIPPVAGTILTVAFELSIVKGWFESVPDVVVALLWFIPVILWIWWLYTHEEVKKRTTHVLQAAPMISLAIFVIGGGVLGASAGALGWWSLKKQHERQIPEVKHIENTLPAPNPLNTEIHGTTDKAEAKPKRHGTQDNVSVTPSRQQPTTTAPTPTAEDIANELAKRLPAIPKQEAGNLKQRTLKLSEDIEREMNERWQNYWASKNTPEEIHTGAVSQSSYFRWKFLAEVKSLHVEFAELHLKVQDLDDFLRYEEMEENARRIPRPPGFPPFGDRLIWPIDIANVVRDLRILANQLKD